MIGITLRSVLSVLVICAASCAHTQLGEPVAIKLDRPWKTNDRYALNASFSHEERIDARTPDGGSKKDRTSQSASLIGNVRLGAMNDRGSPLILLIEVQRFRFRNSGNEEQLADPGRVIVAAVSEGLRHFAFKDGLLSDTGEQLMNFFMDMDRTTDATDEQFGIATPQKSDARWPVNGEALTRNGWTGTQFVFRPLDVKGEVRLRGVRIIHGVRCLHIEAAAHITNANWRNGPPPGMHLDDLTVDYQMEQDCPIDPALPCLNERARIELLAHMKGELRDTPGESKVVMHKWKERTLLRKPLPPATDDK